MRRSVSDFFFSSWDGGLGSFSGSSGLFSECEGWVVALTWRLLGISKVLGTVCDKFPKVRLGTSTSACFCSGTGNSSNYKS